MSGDLWTGVDDYFTGALRLEDEALRAAVAASDTAGLPSIAVSPPQGALLHLIARTMGAETVLEIGTLGGYSTIWLARALPASGRLLSLEIDPRHADVARRNVAAAGVSASVEVRVGPALESLAAISANAEGPFDLFFIDADKPSNPDYFAHALKLSKRGSVIIVDNVVRSGSVADASSTDPAVVGVRALIDLVARELRVRATAIQTVGGKGYDGFLMAVVL